MRSKSSIDFIGIGAQKAGTTWLYERLKELPDFAMPPVKELHYFDRDSSYTSPNRLKETRLLKRLRNRSWVKSSAKKTLKALTAANLQDFKWLNKYYFSNYTDQWYQSLFEGLNGISGDITPAYSMLSKDDIGKMHTLLPEAKLLFLMRNPIDRAWSHYRFIARHFDRLQIDPNDPQNMEDFIRSDRQELRSNYQQTIEYYLTYFKEDQLLLGFYDAIEDQPKALLEEVVSFLGGNPTGVVEYCDDASTVHVSAMLPMPERILEILKEKYYDQLKELSLTYGGYCKLWFDKTYGGGNVDELRKRASATRLINSGSQR